MGDGVNFSNLNAITSKLGGKDRRWMTTRQWKREHGIYYGRKRKQKAVI